MRVAAMWLGRAAGCMIALGSLTLFVNPAAADRQRRACAR